jgi:hypothetical protein
VGERAESRGAGASAGKQVEGEIKVRQHAMPAAGREVTTEALTQQLDSSDHTTRASDAAPGATVRSRPGRPVRRKPGQGGRSWDNRDGVVVLDRKSQALRACLLAFLVWTGGVGSLMPLSIGDAPPALVPPNTDSLVQTTTKTSEDKERGNRRQTVEMEGGEGDILPELDRRSCWNS